jgi:alcohol dehydrogenase (cytochrome c)
MLANRNGFLYVLDRATGEFLRGTPFIRQTWAKGIGADGRPIEMPNQRPTAEGTMTCPDLFGGTNFMSPSYDPANGLFFVSARETCQVYISARPPDGIEAGDRAMGGSSRPAPNEPRYGALRAIDASTGEVKWELRHDAPSWAGALSTASGVVFTGDNEGNFIVAESRTGRELLRQAIGAPFYSSPTTYMIDGRQYVAVVAGSVLTTFALPR